MSITKFRFTHGSFLIDIWAQDEVMALLEMKHCLSVIESQVAFTTIPSLTEWKMVEMETEEFA